MVQLIEIPDNELQKLKRKSNDNYWFICFIMCAAGLGFAWFFSQMEVGFITCGIIIVAFIIGYFSSGEGPVVGKYKIIRCAEVKSVRYIRMGYRVRSSTIEIELEAEELPSHVKDIHKFTIYNSFGGVLTYEQDEGLVLRYNSLEGRTVEIEYIANTGAVLAFRESPPFVLKS